jgi:hypothetical protein
MLTLPPLLVSVELTSTNEIMHEDGRVLQHAGSSVDDANINESWFCVPVFRSGQNEPSRTHETSSAK